MLPANLFLIPFSAFLNLLYGEGIIVTGFYVYIFYLIFQNLKKIKNKKTSLPEFYLNTIWFMSLFSILLFTIIPGTEVIANVTYYFPLMINIALLLKAASKNN